MYLGLKGGTISLQDQISPGSGALAACRARDIKDAAEEVQVRGVQPTAAEEVQAARARSLLAKISLFGRLLQVSVSKCRTTQATRCCCCCCYYCCCCYGYGYIFGGGGGGGAGGGGGGGGGGSRGGGCCSIDSVSLIQHVSWFQMDHCLPCSCPAHAPH